jgi:hypothetical protein
MSDFQKPIEPLPSSFFEKIPPSSRIERDKKKEEESLPFLDPPSLFFFMLILSLLKESLDSLSQAKVLHSSVDLLDSFVLNLNDFKRLLYHIEEEEIDQDADFARNLSSQWHTLLAYRPLLPKISFHLSSRLDHLIHSLFHDPQAEHSLGLYLTEFVGADWIPFPFFDLLNRLHREKPSSSSLLRRWMAQIDLLIEEIHQFSSSLKKEGY